MLAASAETPQLIHGLALAAGALIAAIWWMLHVEFGAARADAVRASSEPQHAWSAVAAGVLAFLLAGMALASWLAPDGAHADPGTDAWHRLAAAEFVAKLFASAVMLGAFWSVRRGASRAETPARLPHSQIALMTVAAAFMLIPVVLLLHEGSTRLYVNLFHPGEPPMHPALRARDNAWNTPGGVPWGTLAIMAGALLAAPISEELLFRGLLLDAVWISTQRVWAAVLVQAVLFGLIHHQQPQDPAPLVAMGAALAYLRLRSGSLVACVVVHALFNLHTLTIAILSLPTS